MGCYQSPPPVPPYAFPAAAPFDITNLIHPASNNALYARKGRLMVKLISQQAGNYARFGDDRGVYIGGNDILSNAGEANLLTINPTDGKITLTASILAAAGVGTGGGTPVVSGVSQSEMQSYVQSYVSQAINQALANVGSGTPTVSGVSQSEMQNYVQNYVSQALSGLQSTGGSVAPSSLISSDANNFLTLGSDGKLLVNLDAGEL